MKIQELYNTIEERKKNRPKGSYCTKLFNAGLDRIVQKLGEESMELVIAAKNLKTREVVLESADLLFHFLVLLSFMDITPNDIANELIKRQKVDK